MKRPLAVSLFLVILGAIPSSAPAQNIWPISFDFWGHHPDKLAPDIRGAEESVAHSKALGRLYDIQIRPAMNQRAGNMSLQELSLYHRQPLFTAIYPDDSEPDQATTPSSPPSSSSTASPSHSSPSAPASGVPTSSSGSPFPSSTATPGSPTPAPSAAPTRSSPGQTVPAAPLAPGPETTPSNPAAPAPPRESAGTAPTEPKP
jgi:hypothetical protein